MIWLEEIDDPQVEAKNKNFGSLYEPKIPLNILKFLVREIELVFESFDMLFFVES